MVDEAPSVPCIPRFGGAAVTRGVDDGVTATILSLQPSKLFSSGKGPQKNSQRDAKTEGARVTEGWVPQRHARLQAALQAVLR